MKIAITDANIFIDLFHLECIDHLFQIGCEVFTTPYVLLELEDHHADELNRLVKKNKLNIERLGPKDELAMLRLRTNRGLSESDLSVLCIAERLDAMILSGDDLVRKTCHIHKIEIHGVLWCLDQFVISKQISKKVACAKLLALMDYNRRLPLADCKKYIEQKWGGTL